MGRKIFENAYRFLEHSEDDDEENEFEQKRSITEAKDKVSKKRRNISSKNPKRSKKIEETFVDSHKKKSEAEEIELYIDVGMVTPRDIYLSSLPQYCEYRTEVHVPKSCIEDDLSNIKYSAQNDDEITSIEYSDKEEICEEESQASIERPVSKHYQEKPSDHKTTKNIETENINEKFQKPTLNVMTTVITEFLSSIRQIYEKGKINNEKKRSYQDLEKERVKCQKRIDRELAFFRRLTEQQYSDTSSSSEEFTDDEVFVKSKSFTEGTEKRKFYEAKRSSSPILIYHYYRPGCKSNEEATYYDSDGCIQNLDSKNPFKTHKELKTSRTIVSANNNEADAKISEERKSNRRSLHSLPSESENREIVLNQFIKEEEEEEEETLDPGLRNTNKSKTSNEKLKIHYEPMTITFDARSNTKPK
ncbi:ABC transporter F family member 4-like [Papilio machaon]|uniref:ABC transporter F family member 4-like n=1 Tax=Papilio machaon TaxID=76193 RepID=UPI001E662E41|nr:ABC transporter F family member 4-like [Papilio machaon]